MVIYSLTRQPGLSRVRATALLISTAETLVFPSQRLRFHVSVARARPPVKLSSEERGDEVPALPCKEEAHYWARA
jgi:hypothetical protein